MGIVLGTFIKRTILAPFQSKSVSSYIYLCLFGGKTLQFYTSRPGIRTLTRHIRALRFLFDAYPFSTNTFKSIHPDIRSYIVVIADTLLVIIPSAAVAREYESIWYVDSFSMSESPAILCTLIPHPSLTMAPSTWICRECTLKDDGNEPGPCLMCQAPHPKRMAVASVPAAAAAPPDNNDAKDNNSDDDDNDNNDHVDLPRAERLVIDIVGIASGLSSSRLAMARTTTITTTTTTPAKTMMAVVVAVLMGHWAAEEAEGGGNGRRILCLNFNRILGGG